MKNINRETWLRAAYKILKGELLPEAPQQAAISWSFPSKGALRSKRRRIGEAWTSGFDRRPEGDGAIFISPTIREAIDVLHVLLHEMIHLVVPDAGHRAPFSKLAKRVGLIKPWTATVPGPELQEKLHVILGKLPEWPKGTIRVVPKEKGRQMKLECPCGRILRGATKTISSGPIICGLCNKPFVLKGVQ